MSIYLTCLEIPVYLHFSAHYRNLDTTDTETKIAVPKTHFAATDQVRNKEEFLRMLDIVCFWMVDRIPNNVINYCARIHPSVWMEELKERVHRSTLLHKLLGIFSTEQELELLEVRDRFRIRPYFGYDIVSKFKSGEELLETEPSLPQDVAGAKETNFLVRAIIVDSIEVVEYLAALWVPARKNDANIMKAACSYGRLKCLKVLHREGFKWGPKCMTSAAQYGHYDCLEYAHTNNCPWNELTLVEAAAGGHLDCLMYAHTNGCPWSAEVCKVAAQQGHLACLKYAHEQGCEWDEETVAACADNGQTNCLRYALEHGCPADSYAWVWAAEAGQRESLRVLHEFQIPWDMEASDAAAESEEFECIQYLHEIGCPWKGDTLSWSTRKGRVDILQYAMEEGCVHSDNLMEITVNNGHLPCLQYLVENQGLYMQEDGWVFAEALLGGHFDCVIYLLDHGCPSYITRLREPDPDYGYTYGSSDMEVLACLEYAVGHGWFCSPIVREYLHKEGMKMCLDFLVSEGQVEPIPAK